MNPTGFVALIIGAIVAMVGSIVGFAMWAESSKCDNISTKMQVEHEWGPMLGCMVKYKGEWLPLSSIMVAHK